MEAQLISAAKADKTEFVQLYDKYFKQIYKFLLTRAADVQLAEDLTSETFIIALEHIDSFEYQGKPFSSWLYRVAINEINKHYRKSKSEHEAMINKWHEEGEKLSAADVELLEGENEQDKLRNLKVMNDGLRKLKEEDQNILSLKYFENLSYQEIAEILGITVTNVGVKLMRATERLSKTCNF